MNFLIALLLSCFCTTALLAEEYIDAKIRGSFSSSNSVKLELSYTQDAPVLVQIYLSKEPKQLLLKLPTLRDFVGPKNYSLQAAQLLFAGFYNSPAPLEHLMLGAKARELGNALGPVQTVEIGGASKASMVAPVNSPSYTAVPEGFTLERARYVDLQKGGQVRTGVYRWNSFETPQKKVVDLGPLPRGLYVVRALQGMLAAQDILKVMDFNLTYERHEHSALARALDFKGAPVVGAKIFYLNSSHVWTALSVETDAKGEVTFEGDERPNQVNLLVAESKSLGIAVSQP